MANATVMLTYDIDASVGRQRVLAPAAAAGTVGSAAEASRRPITARLPQEFRIDAVITRSGRSSTGDVDIRFAPGGVSPTYAIHVVGPVGRTSRQSPIGRWMMFSGLTGGVTEVNDETIDALFGHLSPPDGADAR